MQGYPKSKGHFPCSPPTHYFLVGLGVGSSGLPPASTHQIWVVSSFYQCFFFVVKILNLGIDSHILDGQMGSQEKKKQQYLCTAYIKQPPFAYLTPSHMPSYWLAWNKYWLESIKGRQYKH
jgi:hypothetical protein